MSPAIPWERIKPVGNRPARGTGRGGKAGQRCIWHHPPFSLSSSQHLMPDFTLWLTVVAALPLRPAVFEIAYFRGLHL